MLCSKMSRKQSQRSQVRPAVSNTITEALKQTTHQEAVYFDLYPPSALIFPASASKDTDLLPP